MQASPYGSQGKDLRNLNNHYLISAWRNTAKIVFYKFSPLLTFQKARSIKTRIHQEMGESNCLFSLKNFHLTQQKTAAVTSGSFKEKHRDKTKSLKLDSLSVGDGLVC